MKTIDFSNYLETLSGLRKPWHSRYFAMYSSLLGGVTLDPVLMQVPIDDHLVHRGDGVFDTFKCVGRAAYNLEAHLARLVASAAAIGLAWPGGVDELRERTVATLSAAGRSQCFGRVMLARGPGSLGVSPYDSPEPALYVIVYELGRLFMELHPEGAAVRRSQMPVKPARFATVKNCNYLSNVMMKREAVDWGVDFTVGFDEAGMMAEGATENFGVVTRKGELLFPRIGAVLAGTTMLRVMQLADVLVSEGRLARAAFADVSEREVREADELLIVGTTHNVASARSFEGAALGVRAPGPVGQALNALLERDIAENEALRTTY